MSDLSDEDRRILSYLKDQVSRGEEYFRAKNVANQIGLSAKQVGVRLPRLDERTEELSIEKWSRARSTTWRVRPT